MFSGQFLIQFRNDIAMNTTKIFSIAFAVMAFCLVSKAEAQLSYEFRFGNSDYNVAPGSTVDIDFFLRETATGGSTPRLAPGNGNGLFSYGLNIDFSSFTGTAGSTIASDTDVAINAIFDDFTANDVTLVGSSADVTGVTTNANGEDGTEISTDVYEILLGTATVTAGDEGSVTTLTLADHTDTGGVFSTFADFFNVDAVATYGTANVNVVAIPEPASGLILAGLAGVAMIRRRR